MREVRQWCQLRRCVTVLLDLSEASSATRRQRSIMEVAGGPGRLSRSRCPPMGMAPELPPETAPRPSPVPCGTDPLGVDPFELPSPWDTSHRTCPSPVVEVALCARSSSVAW
jgi:hypothetical protein